MTEDSDFSLEDYQTGSDSYECDDVEFCADCAFFLICCPDSESRSYHYDVKNGIF